MDIMSTNTPPKPPAGVRCRTIGDADLDAVIGLFRKGFAERSDAYWRQGFARHLAHPMPEGYPRYGYLLEAAGQAVGVLLTLFSTRRIGGRDVVTCNLSTWYVEPAFRSQGPMLEKVATRRADVTYLDVTPAPETWPMVEARGYRRYCHGQMLAFPALSPRRRGATVREILRGDALLDLMPDERRLVHDHIGYGCLAFLGADAEGVCPMVFQRRSIGLAPNVKRFGQVPCLQMVYGRDVIDVARFAGPLGRRLLRRTGTPLMVLDAAGPIPGLVGRYFEGRAPKYQLGSAPVPLGDLAYTELVLFGP